MKKVLGIYYDATFNEKSFETGCGGSDTWVIQIAKQFVKNNFHVIVFCDCHDWIISKNGVEYVPIEYFKMRCQYQRFDCFILTRIVDEHVYDTVVETGCKNIFVQSHDLFIWENDMYNQKYEYNPKRYPYIKRYIALTDFHKNNLNKFNNIPFDKIEVIGNGLDSDIFDKVDKEHVIKDNSILFPSVYTRGGDILVEHILPRVLNYIPDFKVHLCGYVHVFPDNVKNNPNVKILGTLSKEDYYREFRKHKVWFLPCTVPEDFGLCAGEAVMSGCDIVSTFEHGMKDVCSPFVNLRMKRNFKTKDTGWYHYSRYELDMNWKDFDETCQEATDMIVDSIRNYNNPERLKLRESFKNYILETHNWQNVVKKWSNMFKICESEE